MPDHELPSNPEDASDLDSGGNKDLAIQETKGLGFSDSDSKRVEGVKQALHWVFIWGLRFIAVLCFAGIVVRVWHFIGPGYWLWLSAEQIRDIDRVLMGVLIGFSGRYFQFVTRADPKRKIS